MKSVRDQLGILKDNFPTQVNKIEDLYHDDPVFRTLCSDYIYCLEALEKLRHEFSEKMNSVGEYEQVKKELENELRDYLKQ
jgi:hypothetical protein